MAVNFFFKQKTAYELRISDWSSDVCSSDLTTAASRKLGSAAMVGICWSRAILPMPTMAIGTGFEGIWVPVSGLSGPAVDSGGIIGDDLFDQDADVVDQGAHCMFGLVGLAGGASFVNGGVVG